MSRQDQGERSRRARGQVAGRRRGGKYKQHWSRLVAALRPAEEARLLPGYSIPTATLLDRVRRLLMPELRLLVLLVPFMFASVALSTINPLIGRALIDNAMFCGKGCPKPGLSAELLSLMAAAMLLSSAMALVASFVKNTIGQNVVRNLRDKLYQHLTNQSLRFFSGTRTGELQTRLMSDVGGINQAVTEGWPNLVQNALGAIGAIVAMLVMSLPLTVVAVVTVLPAALPARWIGRLRRRIALSSQQTSEKMNVLAEETLSVSGALLAKVFGRQSTHVEVFGRQNALLARLTRRNVVLAQGLDLAMQTIYGMAPFAIYLTADILLSHHHGSLAVGTVIAFLGLQARLSGSFQGLVDLWVNVFTSFAYFERIYEYLDLNPEIVDRPGAIALSARDIKGVVELENVSFSYLAPLGKPLEGADPELAPPPGTEHGRYWAVEGVSMTIRPGQVAALVGPSGAGKTTLSYLLGRFYDVSVGAVRIDGLDVRDIQLSSLSALIGMVTQETYILHASLRDNLAYAKPTATEDEIVAAAKSALIHDRIMEMADGYDSIVGERGQRLSGGERQRLALARVILKDPPILVLDEATSSLDTRSERLIQHALSRVKEGRTTVVIAHRLSTIVTADIIFVLDRGRVVEQGTHDELLALGGLYSELYVSHFGSGAIESRTADGLVLAGGQVIDNQVE
ncbi:MAG TPA: ABC transporter ATP-binding protein [Acidimicrobiales bacterium]|nr:ABC transporter ATP-binding protein [Acidimicrobiales bacterium]